MQFLLIAGLLIHGSLWQGISAAAKKDFEDEYGDEDYVPMMGDRHDKFDWQLCAALDEREPGNVVASPMSVKNLLVLLYEGASGKVKDELKELLQLHDNKDVTRALQSAIIKTLQAPNPYYDFQLGMRMYINKHLSPKTRYRLILAEYYNTYVQSLDFEKPKVAAGEINEWTHYITRGHIKNIIADADSIKSAALVLVSAVFFQGQWESPFPHVDSFTGTFTSPEGEKPARFMTQTGYFYYAETDELDAKFLRLPYKGKKFAMYIVLPRRVDGLNILLSKIRPFVLRRLKWQLEETSVSVTIPSFKFEFTMNLKKVLIDMGLELLFTDSESLRAISSSKKASEEVVVSNIVQKASIEVTEYGTVAAAATEATFTHKFGMPELIFNASHPFVFYIEDELTGTVIFEGKYVNPEVKSANLDVRPPHLESHVPIPKHFGKVKRSTGCSHGGVSNSKSKRHLHRRKGDLEQPEQQPEQEQRQQQQPEQEQGPQKQPEQEQRQQPEQTWEVSNSKFGHLFQHKGNLDGSKWEMSRSP